MGRRTIAAYIAGILTAVTLAAVAAYNYFPPPGITYPSNGGAMALAAPTGNTVATLQVSGSTAASSTFPPLLVLGTSTASHSFGETIEAGTNSTDAALIVNNQANTQNFLEIFGDGHGHLGESNANNGLTWSTTGAFTLAAPTAATTSALTITGASSGGLVAPALKVIGSSNSGNETGVVIVAGSTSADAGLIVNNTANTVNFLELFGDGHGNVGPNATNDLAWTTAGDFSVAAPTAGTALSVTGAANAFTLAVQTVGLAANTSNGLRVLAGTSASDVTAEFQPQSGSPTSLSIQGDGGMTTGLLTDEGAATLNVGTGYWVNNTPLALSGINIVTVTTNDTRASTTTPTNSALTFSVPAAGTYLFEVFVFLQQNGAGAIGANLNVNYSGTITNSTVLYSYTAAFTNPGFGVAAAVGTVEDSIPTLNNGFAAPVWIRGLMVVTTTGTFAFAFAQNTSSASTTSTACNGAGLPCRIIIRRIA